MSHMRLEFEISADKLDTCKTNSLLNMHACTNEI